MLSFAWRHAPGNAERSSAPSCSRDGVARSQDLKAQRPKSMPPSPPPQSRRLHVITTLFASTNLDSQNSSALTSHPCGVGQVGHRRIGLLQHPWMMGWSARSGWWWSYSDQKEKKKKKKKRLHCCESKKYGYELMRPVWSWFDASTHAVGMPSIATLLLLLLLLSRLDSIMGRRRQLLSLTSW
ncbi:hypothetical protein BKA80DRAFT_99321 [Phyllosticta citrichinensis]